MRNGIPQYNGFLFDWVVNGVFIPLNSVRYVVEYNGGAPQVPYARLRTEFKTDFSIGLL